MNKETGKIAVVLAHPNLNESRANKELVSTIKELDCVVVYNLYEDFSELFDAEIWTQIMLESSALVYQFPMYWMSAPYMLKKWQDEVFTSLTKTPMLAGKPLMVVTTVGNEFDAYRSGGRNRFTVDEILRPYQAGAISAGMKWMSPIVVYEMDAEQIGKNLTEGSIIYKERLELIESATQVNILSDW